MDNKLDKLHGSNKQAELKTGYDLMVHRILYFFQVCDFQML